MHTVLPCVSSAAAGIVGSLFLVSAHPATLDQLKSRVDSDFARKVEHLVIESSPGNPRDAEIWTLLHSYGLVNFLAQARLQVSIATEREKAHGASAERENQMKTSLLDLYTAVVGCALECAMSHFCPGITRMQAFVAAQIFTWLCLDVEDQITYSGA